MKVYLDKVEFLETFGAFHDQKFYSMEYTGPDAAEVSAYAENVREFQGWCKAAYVAMRQGIEPPAPPSFISNKTNKVAAGSTRAKKTKPSKKESS